MLSRIFQTFQKSFLIFHLQVQILFSRYVVQISPNQPPDTLIFLTDRKEVMDIAASDIVRNKQVHSALKELKPIRAMRLITVEEVIYIVDATERNAWETVND
ncbi:hypothetical protein ATO8_01715 [Roseivivax marinus]|uniref:Uncharacterized protein n=1 Tax=Roseivivax marinus TaxID=1379903 RepID=W4HPG0_9RHOB|nr:hypothetical protein ATO8_01715 [Roseivivax marinus]